MAFSPDQEKTEVGQPDSADQPISPTAAISTAPLSVVLLQLPRLYFNALVKPSLATYAEFKGQASWRLVWIQLATWAILDAALGVLVNTLYPPATGTAFSRFFAFATTYGLVVVVPALFFLLMGIVYWIARAFGGKGTFLEQCHTSLIVEAPLGILSKLLALIPGIGRILNSVLSLYGIVLMVVVIIAVHRQSKGKIG
ncbi:MAG TPA: YIP1 family protein [Ktedonobacteraceae bacterium]|nr:YIP1 family protein [Ktedonobacteraceae bacterium]